MFYLRDELSMVSSPTAPITVDWRFVCASQFKCPNVSFYRHVATGSPDRRIAVHLPKIDSILHSVSDNRKSCNAIVKTLSDLASEHAHDQELDHDVIVTYSDCYASYACIAPFLEQLSAHPDVHCDDETFTAWCSGATRANRESLEENGVGFTFVSWEDGLDVVSTGYAHWFNRLHKGCGRVTYGMQIDMHNIVSKMQSFENEG